MRKSDHRQGNVVGSLRVAAFSTLLMLACSGCYTVGFYPAEPVPSEPVPAKAEIIVPKATAEYTFTTRSFMAGIANTWTIHLGEVLSDYANAYILPPTAQGEPVQITMSINSFNVKSFTATLETTFVVQKAGRPILNKRYASRSNGNGNTGIVFSGGAFAMKAVMRQTTIEAIKSVMEQFMHDLREVLRAKGETPVTSDLTARLKELDQLKSSGALSAEEHDKARRALLNSVK